MESSEVAGDTFIFHYSSHTLNNIWRAENIVRDVDDDWLVQTQESFILILGREGARAGGVSSRKCLMLKVPTLVMVLVYTESSI